MQKRRCPRLRDIGMRTKLVVSYLIVLVALLGLLSIYAQQISRNFVREYVGQSLSSMVARAGSDLSLKFQQYEQFADFSIANPHMQAIYSNRYFSYYRLYSDLRDWLVPFFSGMRTIASDELKDIKIYSERGLEQYADVVYPSKAVEEEQWYVNARSSPYSVWGYDQKEGTFYIARRIVRMNGMLGDTPLGVLRLNLRAEQMLSGYANIGCPEYGYVILDADGRGLLERGNDLALPADAYPAPDARDIVYEGKSYMVFAADIPGPNWRVIYTVPMDSMWLDPPRLIMVNTILLAIGISVLLLIIWIFTTTMFKGIKKLENKIERVSAGEIDIGIESDAGDEIGRLTNRFGNMLSTLRALIEEKERTQRRLVDLELRALRAQIDPHFLYNTLSLINWRAIRTNDEEIIFMVDQLATFYRTCLNKGQALIRVEDEITNINAYLEIQRRMHHDAFDVRIDVEHEIMDAYMLNFLLQPLVENAVMHGIDNLREGRGFLEVRGSLSDDLLYFQVTDNGPGLHQTDAMNTPTKGYGLTNVIERIHLRYGPEYGVEMLNKPEGGCVVRLRIPVLFQADGVET